jgi:hypothetical protein
MSHPKRTLMPKDTGKVFEILQRSRDVCDKLLLHVASLKMIDEGDSILIKKAYSESLYPGTKSNAQIVGYIGDFKWVNYVEDKFPADIGIAIEVSTPVMVTLEDSTYKLMETDEKEIQLNIDDNLFLGKDKIDTALKAYGTNFQNYKQFYPKLLAEEIAK